AYASSNGYNGCARWFNSQYQEEMSHAMKLFKYLEDQGADVVLSDIKATVITCKSIVEAFKQALEHERKMTVWLNDLSDEAVKEKDHATYNLLQWYVTEQVEEESSFSEIIDQMTMVGDNGYGLYAIDKELGSRQFVDNTQVQ
ncbi:ferritin, partial [Sulfurospirillum sp.]|nr:ferritin [Sulfurospirillum sp.]